MSLFVPNSKYIQFTGTEEERNKKVFHIHEAGKIHKLINRLSKLLNLTVF